MRLPQFQSPRGDFGFLKISDASATALLIIILFQSPRGDFGFLKPSDTPSAPLSLRRNKFQSPRGDFGFLKVEPLPGTGTAVVWRFQSPRGDFGFLKDGIDPFKTTAALLVSIPSRGFWFFEVAMARWRCQTKGSS